MSQREPTDFEQLYREIPRGSKYRKLASRAHGYGHDDGYDEGRADMLNQLERQLLDGKILTLQDVFDWIRHRKEKAKKNGRWPEGF